MKWLLCLACPHVGGKDSKPPEDLHSVRKEVE